MRRVASFQAAILGFVNNSDVIEFTELGRLKEVRSSETERLSEILKKLGG